MATEKVGIYRKYHGKVPVDNQGRALPKVEWPRKRAFRWAVRWFGSDGKRYSKSLKSRKEAQKYAEGKQTEANHGKRDVPKSMTLEEFSKMYLKLRSDLMARTFDEHKRTLKFLKERIGANQPIQRITPLDARRFIAWYRKRTVKDGLVSPTTVNKVIRECRRIFREAIDCELLHSNPFGTISQGKTGETDWYYVSSVEFQKLFKACPSNRWQGMVALAYCCGMRLGEILNLTWSDIDFEHNLVRIVSKRRQAGAEDWTPKDKDMRIVPLSDTIEAVLTRLHAEAEDGQVYVFVNSKGPATGGRIKRQNMWRDFQVIRRKANVPQCSLHDLRKSYCTNLAGAVPMHVLQELAGHSDIRTTMRYYVKVQPQYMEAARRAVEASLETCK